MTIMAIDPGTTRSAWVEYDTAAGKIVDADISTNEELLELLRNPDPDVEAVVIEQVASYGMPVGVEVFETVYWSGRFAQAAQPTDVYRLPRMAVKMALCGSSRAKDPNVRQALLDRFGGASAVGTKKSPGPLYGIKSDLWAALGVAVAWTEASR